MVEDAKSEHLRHLALSKLWAELHRAHLNRDQELVEYLEYQAMMLLLACQKVDQILTANRELGDPNR